MDGDTSWRFAVDARVLPNRSSSSSWGRWKSPKSSMRQHCVASSRNALSDMGSAGRRQWHALCGCSSDSWPSMVVAQLACWVPFLQSHSGAYRLSLSMCPPGMSSESSLRLHPYQRWDGETAPSCFCWPGLGSELVTSLRCDFKTSTGQLALSGWRGKANALPDFRFPKMSETLSWRIWRTVVPQ